MYRCVCVFLQYIIQVWRHRYFDVFSFLACCRIAEGILGNVGRFLEEDTTDSVSAQCYCKGNSSTYYSYLLFEALLGKKNNQP